MIFRELTVYLDLSHSIKRQLCKMARDIDCRIFHEILFYLNQNHLFGVGNRDRLEPDLLSKYKKKKKKRFN